MIPVGGFNVYPAEIENLLVSHPKVALAAVIGIPDATSGEKVKAFIQLKPGESATEGEIPNHCKTVINRGHNTYFAQVSILKHQSNLKYVNVPYL